MPPEEEFSSLCEDNLLNYEQFLKAKEESSEKCHYVIIIVISEICNNNISNVYLRPFLFSRTDLRIVFLQ